MEDIEDPSKFTYFALPSSNIIWKYYKKAQASFWPDEDVDINLTKDKQAWDKIDNNVKKFITHIVAFFFISDGKVVENIQGSIENRITPREISTWYNMQKTVEDIHNITYAKLMTTYVTDPLERNKIFNCVENYPTIGAKIRWTRKWLGEDNPFRNLSRKEREYLKSLKAYVIGSIQNTNETLKTNFSLNDDYIDMLNKIDEPLPPLGRQILVNVIMEGLFFTGSFASIFWINHVLKGILPGLAQSNELISRDEGLHTAFGILLYTKYIRYKLPQSEVHEMFREAVIIECEFMEEALPFDLLGLNSKLMIQYIKYIADHLLEELGYDTLYEAKLPSELEFLIKQSIGIRITDFFISSDVTEYGLAGAGNRVDDQELDVLSDEE